MRRTFWIFLIASLVFHVLLFSVVSLNTKNKRIEKPIAVRIIPMPKQEKTPVPRQSRPAPPPRVYEKNTPLDDSLNTKVEQSAPAIKKEARPSKNNSSNNTGNNKAQAEKPAQKAQSPKSTGSKLPEIPAASPAELPKVSSGSAGKGQSDAEKQKEEDARRINNIMNPKDVINKYATGGEEATGTDSVSMQYVKMRYQSYFAKFARRLYQVWSYPYDAGMRGEQGTVQASFLISRDGTISSINILRSSGYPDLDNEVMVALKKMYGVPLPENYKLDTLKVDANFRYILGGGFSVY